MSICSLYIGDDEASTADVGNQRHQTLVKALETEMLSELGSNVIACN